MKIECPSCGKQFVLDDAKVPSRPFTAKCPSCKGRIAVSPPAAAKEAAPPPVETDAPPPPRGEGAPPAPDPRSPNWEQMKREVAAEVLKGLGVKVALEDEEYEGQGSMEALVCEDEAEDQDAIRTVLLKMGYRVDVVDSTEEAVRHVQGHRYQIVTVDSQFPGDPEGGLKILRAAGSMPSEVRRKMVIAYISDDLASLDMNSAFILGANVTVNKRDMEKLDKILRSALAEHERVYRNYFLLEEEVKNLEVRGLRRSG